MATIYWKGDWESCFNYRDNRTTQPSCKSLLRVGKEMLHPLVKAQSHEKQCHFYLWPFYLCFVSLIQAALEVLEGNYGMCRAETVAFSLCCPRGWLILSLVFSDRFLRLSQGQECVWLQSLRITSLLFCWWCGFVGLHGGWPSAGTG